MDADDVGGFAVVAGIVLVVAGALGLAGWAIVGSVRSNGEADYCYVQVTSPTGMAPQYMLFAHRPWREDRHLGTYPEPDAATVEAKLLDCPLNRAR